ncbi:F-box/kelch-repeat protein OR23 [Andrographis paniculata]|uniref:F-box/kelch-repeat protein OR23 n=1 Tax=Andrographis paniculata TaxID=175694 RepID=UPI0021E87474|nr:F-box/kelch-repeat protein OR23 [Andrographis paniculata]
MAPPSSSSSTDEFGMQTLTLTLIPGLPNDLGALILAFVPYSHQSRLKSICKSWRRFFSSRALISLRQTYVVPPQLLCIFRQDPSISSPYLFDPRNQSWCPLPPMPCNPHVYGLSNFISVSVGPHLYVLGGSLFDTRSFPLDRPSPSSSAYRFDFSTFTWDSLSPMITARGSFACAAAPEWGKIVVAGGGSRHAMFGAAGSRMSSVEMYDIVKDEWVALDGLPRFRAGCVGFFMGTEFWVMGGYGESRTVSGVFPVDEYYKDAVAMELKNGGKWRELGDMWEDGGRRKLGKIVVVEDVYWDASPGIFMLDRSEIFRYDRSCNRWEKETSMPRKASDDGSVGFVGIDGELHLFILVNSSEPAEGRRSRSHNKRSATLLIQIYDPRKRSWRSVMAKPPFHQPIDFRTAVMSTIRL